MFQKPPLPKEHRAWAILIVSLLTGLVLAPVWYWRMLMLLVAAFAFFLMRHPLATLVKTRKRANVNKASLVSFWFDQSWPLIDRSRAGARRTYLA